MAADGRGAFGRGSFLARQQQAPVRVVTQEEYKRSLQQSTLFSLPDQALLALAHLHNTQPPPKPRPRGRFLRPTDSQPPRSLGSRRRI